MVLYLLATRPATAHGGGGAPVGGRLSAVDDGDMVQTSLACGRAAERVERLVRLAIPHVIRYMRVEIG